MLCVCFGSLFGRTLPIRSSKGLDRVSNLGGIQPANNCFGCSGVIGDSFLWDTIDESTAESTTSNCKKRLVATTAEGCPGKAQKGCELQGGAC